ncbi:Protein SGT1 homolog [Seminavis robusta]|uniref:Protein SGT1 homolog n=1 Tax=Seminavis robusta TaxID=568900 RepID=A0A9N8H1J1_9STRA|nr:Protein SGT1 homolog [Seminavis robusta]|eukprot:Sro4_g003520.1 Protein SGT1 homolog (448) ;mRNA; f:175442-176878
MKIEEVTEDKSPAELLSLGDACFVDEDFEASIDAYAAALSVVGDDDKTLQFRCLSHRSAAFYRLRRNNEALEDAREALELLSSSNNSIAALRAGESEMCHKRAGVAAMNMQDFTTAKTYFEQAQQLATLNRGDEKAYKSYLKQCDYNLKPREKPSMPMPSGKDLPSPPTETKPALKKQAVAAKPVAKAPEKPKPVISPPKPSSKAPPSNKKPVTGMPKYQYYQNDKFVKIELLEPNVQESDLEVRFEETHLTVKLTKNAVPYTVISGHLYNEVDVEGCKTIFKGEKVLIKLKKQNLNFEWQELLGKRTFKEPTPSTTAAAAGETKQDDNGVETSPPPPADSSDSSPRVRPYASHKDWDQIEKELTDQEKSEKPEGDEAMNKLFQQIYATADDETRRAMVKSYQTSGGTVLSTNWNEVKEKDYEKERTAPKGMEWKNWEGDKLPQSDD